MSNQMIDRSHGTRCVVISRIPRTLVDEFNEWCKKRGYTRTGKLQRIMDSYIRGKIDDGVKQDWYKPHWRKLHKKHSLEWKRICRHYPDDDITSISIQGVPNDLYWRFSNYCNQHGYTVAGKLRKIMLDCINGDLKYKGHTFKS